MAPLLGKTLFEYFQTKRNISSYVLIPQVAFCLSLTIMTTVFVLAIYTVHEFSVEWKYKRRHSISPVKSPKRSKSEKY